MENKILKICSLILYLYNRLRTFFKHFHVRRFSASFAYLLHLLSVWRAATEVSIFLSVLVLLPSLLV